MNFVLNLRVNYSFHSSYFNCYNQIWSIFRIWFGFAVRSQFHLSTRINVVSCMVSAIGTLQEHCTECMLLCPKQNLNSSVTVHISYSQLVTIVTRGHKRRILNWNPRVNQQNYHWLGGQLALILLQPCQEAIQPVIILGINLRVKCKMSFSHFRRRKSEFVCRFYFYDFYLI